MHCCRLCRWMTLQCLSTVTGDGQQAAGSDADAVVGAAGPSPSGHETFVQVERLQQGLCGRSRPHFFRGVATVRLLATLS